MQHVTKTTKRILHPHGLALAGESNTYAPATRAVTPSRRILARKGAQAGGNAPHGPMRPSTFLRLQRSTKMPEGTTSAAMETLTMVTRLPS